jgi:hypothetical protein
VGLRSAREGLGVLGATRIIVIREGLFGVLCLQQLHSKTEFRCMVKQNKSL